MGTLDDTRHSSTRFFRRCYDVDANHLRRIVAVIKERTRGDVDISISLDESETISGTSLDALLQNAALDVLSIDEIRVRASKISSNDLDELSILYRRSNMVGSVRVNIGGKGDAVFAAREEIGRLIDATSRWFWILNYKGSPLAFFIYIIILGSAGMFLAAYSMITISPSILHDEYSNFVGMMYFLLTLAFVNVIWYLRDTFFPVMEFRIGKSGIGADFRDTLRKYVFVTALGGIALSFLGRIAWERVAGSMTPPK